MLDPSPKFYMGDSRSYIATAVTGWIPPDRSFFYGYVIRWLAVWTSSLTPLLIFQTLVGAMTAIIVAAICRGAFGLPPLLSFAAGLACCFDPLQLLWERYVMTETISLLIYAVMLYVCFRYLKRKKIADLVLVQAIATLLIGFRISYLLLVQVNAVLLPLLAFLPLSRSDLETAYVQHHVPAIRLLGHIVLSCALMFVLHHAYKELNGKVSKRYPAYGYDTGLHLLAAWAPALDPSDAPDPRLQQVIAQGKAYHIRDLDLRNNQRFSPDFLVDRWQRMEKQLVKANEIARQTAVRALRRNPLGILRLAGQTYLEFWQPALLLKYAQLDLGHPLTPNDTAVLATYFHLVQTPSVSAAARPTLLQKYFLAARYYCLLALVLPVFALITVLIRPGSIDGPLILIHATVLVCVISLFTVNPSIRYVQPISLLAILTIAAWVPYVPARRNRTRVTAIW
jgi:hypothetical protein